MTVVDEIEEVCFWFKDMPPNDIFTFKVTTILVRIKWLHTVSASDVKRNSSKIYNPSIRSYSPKYKMLCELLQNKNLAYAVSCLQNNDNLLKIISQVVIKAPHKIKLWHVE